MHLSDADAGFIRRRAAYRCEYCLLPGIIGANRFEYDHIFAQQHGGPTTLDNLAWACKHCNKFKGPNLSGLEIAGRRSAIVRLFHPRRHRWTDHFQIDDLRIVGTTAIGRVTVKVLVMNHATRLELREQYLKEGWIPLTHPRTAKD